jgi:hypothetical protein
MECAHAAILSSGCAVNGMLRDYFAEHIPEERGHDEWVLNDCAKLGISREAVLGRMPSSNIAAVVGAQYYWIHHYSPLALVGYIFVIEGYPPTPDEVQQYILATGIQADAFSTLRRHAELDAAHARDLDGLIDSLPLTNHDIGVIGISAFATVKCFADEMRRLTQLDCPAPGFVVPQ